MNVLFIPHSVEHYTVGLSEELKKNVKLVMFTTKYFETGTKQIVIPNFPVFRGLTRKIFFLAVL